MRVHSLTSRFALGFLSAGGRLHHTQAFETLTLSLPGQARAKRDAALQAGYNVRLMDEDSLSLSFLLTTMAVTRWWRRYRQPSITRHNNNHGEFFLATDSLCAAHSPTGDSACKLLSIPLRYTLTPYALAPINYLTQTLKLDSVQFSTFNDNVLGNSINFGNAPTNNH